MHIGKHGTPVSHISQAYPDRVEVRGRDLTGDLMGRLTFTEYFHLLLTGREPTDDERFFLDLLLVAIAEHGLMPSNVAARMTLAADPGSLQGAVAAGILGAGSVVLGASEECARLLEQGGDPLTIARTIHDAGGKVPGFGHPVHKPVDPRTERILALADERGVNGPHVALARALRDAVAEIWEKPYAAHLAERNPELTASSVVRVLVAGEPGGGELAFRAKLEEGWGARVTEAMGIGDIGVSLWGECEEQDGMHLGARGFVHAELIDPDSGDALELDDGASGELVLTHLQHRAAPLLRFRTRDHVQVRTSPCKFGRTSPRLRCVGRTDDMLIVRGVNVFPSAVREVVSGFAQEVSGHILIKPSAPGVKQEPPLLVAVELAPGRAADAALAERIREKLRNVLVVQTRVDLVPCGSLQRSEYKSKLVER